MPDKIAIIFIAARATAQLHEIRNLARWLGMKRKFRKIRPTALTRTQNVCPDDKFRILFFLGSFRPCQGKVR